MKKSLLTLIIGIFLINTPCFSQATRTTITSGLATNPLVWDCTCVPAVNDNIIVNHALTMNIDYGYTSGYVLVNSTGSLTGDIATRAFAVAGTGTFTNHGTVNLGDFYHGGGTFSNDGTFTIGNAFALDLAATASNSGTMNITDSVYINTNASIGNSATLNYGTIANAGTFNNSGSVTGNDILNSGNFTNFSGIGINANTLYTNNSFTNSAYMHLSTDLWNSENFINNNHIVVDNNLWTGDTIAGTATFTNNGTISVGNSLTNSEAMNGTGDYCISNTSTNGGAITGTLDFCDLTGGSFDVNIGTIGGGVTYCSGGLCSVGNFENEFMDFSIYPNPSNGIFTISFTANVNAQLLIFNSNGLIVHSEKINGAQKSIDISKQAKGIYCYQIISGNQISKGNLIIE